MESLKRGN